MAGCHDNVGHFGLDRTINLQILLAHMLDQAKEYVGSCQRCLVAKGKQQLAPLQPYHADARMELVHMDYLTIEHGKTNQDL